MAELRSGVAAIDSQREEAPARIAAIHRADVMRVWRLAARIVLKGIPYGEGGECFPKVRRGAEGHGAAEDEGGPMDENVG